MVFAYAPCPTFDQTCRGNKSRGDPSGSTMAFGTISAIAISRWQTGCDICKKQVVELPSQGDLFIPGPSGINIFKGVPNTAALALCKSFADAHVS